MVPLGAVSHRFNLIISYGRTFCQHYERCPKPASKLGWMMFRLCVRTIGHEAPVDCSAMALNAAEIIIIIIIIIINFKARIIKM